MSDSTAFPACANSASASLQDGPLCLKAKQGDSAFQKVAASIAVWSWILVVFATLMGLKLWMIFGQGQNLYEAHWRIGGVRMNALSYVAFYLFVILGGMSLFRLGSCCQSVGIKSIRAVNAMVLVLGLSFIFLTFHNGDRNYLYPIVSGVLTWSSLLPYSANSFFFNQPFLAAWIFVYAAGYYVLARTGRERMVLYLSAVFGAAYGLIYLQELMLHGNELLIVDCLGVIALAMSRRSNARDEVRRDRLSMVWLLLPAAWTLFFALDLLRFDSQWNSNAVAYCLSLLGLTLALFLAAGLLIRKLGNPAAWNWLVPCFFVAFFILANHNYPSSSNYNHLLCLALTVPRYFAGDLAVVGLMGLAALVYRKLRPTGSLWWLDCAGLAFIFLAGIDLRLSQIMGTRLGWDVLAFGDSPKMMLKMAKPYLPGALVGLLVAGGAYALALRGLRHWAARRFAGQTSTSGATHGVKPGPEDRATSLAMQGYRGQEFPPFATGRPGALFLAAVFIALAILGVLISDTDKIESQPMVRMVQTSPLWKHVANRTLNRQEFLNAASSLGLGDFAHSPNSVPGQAPRNLNLVVVFMESSYNKHLSLFGGTNETQPLLSKYKDRMELFPNLFSAFTGSIHARFATFTSLYPVRDFQAFTQERVPVKSLFEVMHDQGYNCSMFYSSYFDYTGFRDFLKNRGLDEMYDADTMPGRRLTERVEWGLMEEETLGAIRNQLKKYGQNRQRFCLTYVPAAPHYPYDRIPKLFQKYKPKEVGDFKPRYLDELLYMDWVLASIVDELKESGLLENTLIVITNDHGEQLGGEDGQIGHGWKVTPELANTPLIVMDPERRGFQINRTIGTQVDVLPTILDRLNIPIPEGQLYEGKSLYAGPARQGRTGYLSSYEQFAILSDDQIIVGDRGASNPGGLASGRSAYQISNEGSKTLFTKMDTANDVGDPRTVMAGFDKFQENLLRNYSFYCASVHEAAQQIAKRSDR